MLPFLKGRQVPKLRTMSGVSKYGFSEDEELCERALDELEQAIDTKDKALLLSAVKALIHCIMNKEGPDAESHE